MSRILPVFPACLAAVIGFSTTVAQDPGGEVFRSTVRETEPLTPAEEMSRMTVPPGFRVTLFASEPQIQKPMNMAFDADGRLWVTGSNLYPFPAKEGPGSDSIHVLEDTNGDGSADRISTFADDLNIPIGLYPWQDGVIVFSIPDILFLRDTNGDGKADQRQVLYGPFDTTRDTHGMNNAFRRGFDGWLYCCHGFNNQSTVAGADGHSVTMHSGNTYRIRPDGSRIEHFTHGQVNPFGMAIDANGDLFTSDCHTKPVTLLMRDGFYESFGRPDDGLGFVPPVMDHLHGSTAIDGLCQYQGTKFPADYHDDLFVGNVMTCRVHRNSIVRTGSSVRMQEEPDFLTCSDPWFRPVDIQVGPDGALYVADFYNRVIGHYEVPLDHPGRDRSRARIWKISWVGDVAQPTSNSEKASTPPLSQASVETLITSLRDARKPVRQHALDQLADRHQAAAVPAIQSALSTALQSADQVGAAELLWAAMRLNVLEAATLTRFFRQGNLRTRIHVQRIASEQTASPEIDALIRLGLRDPEGLVRRAAADAAGRHASIDLMKEVINATAVCSDDDVHLKHNLKIALRHQLNQPDSVGWFIDHDQPEVAQRAVADILPAVTGQRTTELVLSLLQRGAIAADQRRQLMQHAAENASPENVELLMALVDRNQETSVQQKADLQRALSEGFRRRNVPPPSGFLDWSRTLGDEIFRSIDLDEIHWGTYQLDDRPAGSWQLEDRVSAENSGRKIPFLSSLPGGEKAVGILRSRSFVIPLTLELEICGHLGFPDKPAIPENRVVVRDLKTGQELAAALPPRNDRAVRSAWSLLEHVGRRGFIEVTDGIDLSAYAWLAVGPATPRVVSSTAWDGGASASLLASALRTMLDRIGSGQPLTDSEVARLAEILNAIHSGGEVRQLAAECLLRHRGRQDLLPLAGLLPIATLPMPVEQLIVDCAVMTDRDLTARMDRLPPIPGVTDPAPRRIRTVFADLNEPLRRRLAVSLSASEGGAEMLLTCIESGVPSAEIFRDQRLVQQISAFGPAFADRVTALVTALPDTSADNAQLAADLLRQARLFTGDASGGKAIFDRHCRTCHRRGGSGELIGPQLDGIEARGRARLLEDIIQPNRNVDVAFRTSVLVLNDGRVVSGIVRETPGSSMQTVFGSDGKPQNVLNSDIEERRDSNLSLMPANVASQLKPEEMLLLIEWLMTSGRL
ncbi:MAG: c-type cytochrome [Planctomycetaceae bacterium]